jgi:hypothetical protein
VLGGGVYGLMAAGLTLIFGVLGIITIAQGILVVLGSYLSYVLWAHLHIDVFLGLVITVPAMFALGVAIQWLFIRPLRGRERTSMSLLAACVPPCRTRQRRGWWASTSTGSRPSRSGSGWRSPRPVAWCPVDQPAQPQHRIRPVLEHPEIGALYLGGAVTPAGGDGAGAAR